MTATGRKPFKEWVDGLDRVTRAKIRIRLDRVRLGNLGKNRHAGEGVYELKIDYGPGYRGYYALNGRTVVLLLLGGDKSTQGKDILKVKTYWQDFKKRGNND
ncbi:MAG: type II toxin-antitoxin system RelE/ParE family toxin [Deltaproteobacteria bacterium]|nr:type II toxin-antitoxin system RelE/ParE family toxin [Deltaproteobacteria bacterium]